MVVCRNWTGAVGSCRFGDRCRFEHPEPDRGNISSRNPFSPLQNNHTNTRNGNGYQAGSSASGSLPFNLDKDQIITDLSTERPLWILSAYGPGRLAPEQLFGGPIREQSFEEIHLLHRIAEREGNVQQAVQEAQKLFQQSEHQMQTALSDVDGAINYILNAEKNHPNRLDIVQNSMSGTLQNTNAFASENNSSSIQVTPPTHSVFGAPSQTVAPSAFGAPSMTTTSGAFGQPLTLGAKPSVFDASSQAFGAPSLPVPGIGAFGQPSSLGQKQNPFGVASQPLPSSGAFGQASDHGQKPNPFGTTSQPTSGGGAFGQASNLGRKPNPFGPPSGGGFSGFAQAGSAFGQPSQPITSSPFGAPSQPAPSNPFGATSQPAPANQFSGASATTFGAPSQAHRNVLGPPSGQVAASRIFGPSSQPAPPNPFGGASAPTVNPSGTTPPVARNPLGTPQVNAPGPTNPFGAHSNGQSSTNLNSFGNRSPGTSSVSASYKPTACGDTGHPPLSSYATHVNGKLTMWKGQRVLYRDGEPGFKGQDDTWEKIWYPDGPPPPNPDTEMPDSMYDEETKQAFLHHRRTGKFPNSKMPFLPPKQEWCLWDF